MKKDFVAPVPNGVYQRENEAQFRSELERFLTHAVTLSREGRLDLGKAPTASTLGILIRSRADAVTATNNYLAHMEMHQHVAAAASTIAAISAAGIAQHPSGTIATLSGIQAVAQHLGAGHVNNIRAVDARAVGTGSCDWAIAFMANNPGTPSTANAVGFYLQAITSGTNRYGMYLEDVDGGSNNYAIYTNDGLVRFGDDVKVHGNVDVIDGAVTAVAGRFLDGDPSAIRLFAQAAASQTAAIVRVNDSGGNALLRVTDANEIVADAPFFSTGGVNLTGLPTSAAGLDPGTVWSDSGTLKVA